MSELRRNGGADDADEPVVNDKAADKPVERPRLEIRTADNDPERPVNRPLVTKTQRYYANLIKESGDVPPVGDTDVVYVRDWASGDSLDHKYPHIAGGKDRGKPDDPPGETVRDNAPDGGPSVSIPAPPALQHTNATGVERLRAADAASRDDQPARDKSLSWPDDSPNPGKAPEKGLSSLDARAIQDTDDGWDDVLIPATKPARERTSPTEIPDDVGDRSASMSIPDARSMLAERERTSPGELGRGDYALDARAIQRTDNAWYDKTELTDTAGNTSKLESFLREGGKESDDILQYTHDRVDDIAGMVTPPTHAEVGKIPPPPLMSDPLHGAPHTPGDVAAGVLAGAYALTALDHIIRKTIEDRKDRHGGNGDG